MERADLIQAYRSGAYRVTELADRYGVSRQTVYKWLARYAAGGVGALVDRSHARLHQDRRTTPALEAFLVDFRRTHSTWGPRKVLDVLARDYPELTLPARSTVGAIFDRHGLTQRRRSRRRPLHPGSGPIYAQAANDVWTADFKGEFKTRDGVYCYPLTVCDAYSRFVLECRGLPSVGQAATTQRFKTLFAEHGLPSAIRTDNGPPFATQALCGLSRLSVWWIKLGIAHQRIDPGRPQQNGRHERMHRTLKAETTRPPEANAAAQQLRFDTWRAEFNTYRPHEALDGQTPDMRYAPASRTAPAVAPEPEYPGHFECRRVSHGGTIKWRGQHLFITSALSHETIALEEVDDGVWSLYFCDRLLARFDERVGVLVQ